MIHQTTQTGLLLIQVFQMTEHNYDGELVGLPVASFTTTRRNGDLATFSPYPRGGTPGRMYWRVTIPF